MDKAKIEDFCSAPAELFQVHSLHLISPEYSAGLQVHSLHLISSGMLCQTSGAFTAPHLYQNALPDFRCIHCTSSLPECSAGLQVHSLHLISTGKLHQLQVQ